MRDVESRQVDLSSDVRALFERANASRVTVFTIDAAEERELGIGSIEETGLPSIAEGARTGSGAASAMMNTTTTLISVATMTPAVPTRTHARASAFSDLANASAKIFLVSHDDVIRAK